MMEELERFLESKGAKGRELMQKMKHNSEDVSFYKAIHEMMRRVRIDVMTVARGSRRRETPSSSRRLAVVAP